jgi:hypothetical protein
MTLPYPGIESLGFEWNIKHLTWKDRLMSLLTTAKSTGTAMLSHTRKNTKLGFGSQPKEVYKLF